MCVLIAIMLLYKFGYAILKLLLAHTIPFACSTQVHEKNTKQNFNHDVETFVYKVILDACINKSHMLW